MRHDEISPKLYGVETHLKRSKIDSFSFVHCFVLQRRRCGNIYKVIDNHCPGHAPSLRTNRTCFMCECDPARVTGHWDPTCLTFCRLCHVYTRYLAVITPHKASWISDQASPSVLSYLAVSGCGVKETSLALPAGQSLPGPSLLHQPPDGLLSAALKHNKLSAWQTLVSGEGRVDVTSVKVWNGPEKGGVTFGVHK